MMSKHRFKQTVLYGVLTAGSAVLPLSGYAQAAAASPDASAAPAAQVPAPSPGQVQEIVVTAQKRSQSINSVPLTVSAATADTLKTRGVVNTADLAKIIPGFDAAPSTFGEPVYILRGIGLFDNGLASSQPVSVYVDQIPLAFPIMTEVAPLDLERVEVLKGPQGTLFGQNSTGGAINYIAAKPTSTFAAGLDATVAQYGSTDDTAFISGPLSDTLSARVSARTVQGGAYQYSITRPGDHLGDADVFQGRVLLDWHPTDRLKFELNVNAFHDGSDTVAGQLIAVTPAKPANASAALIASPIAPANDRAADWPAGYPFHSDDSFYQVSLRTDYQLSPAVAITSLTSYGHMTVNKLADIAATAAAGEINLIGTVGRIKTFSQELRIGGNADSLIWVAGANYDHSQVSDGEVATVYDTADQPVGPIVPAFHHAEGLTTQTIDDYALFGNLDYRATDRITLHGGLRGTISDRHGDSCAFDPEAATDGDPLGKTYTVLQEAFIARGQKKTPLVIPPLGGCLSLTPAPDLSPSGVHEKLNESNLSWRVGADYKSVGGTLLYANVSVGYKSGIISDVVASSTTQYNPVKQERVLAYEAGIKAPLLNHLLQFNSAAFYDDYTNKQLRTQLSDPTFGSLNQLINIPKSRIWGIEAELQARPVRGLTFNVSGTYLNSKVTRSFVAENAEDVTGDFKGSILPYTPKFEGIGDVQYEFAIAQNLKAFAGSSLVYHDQANATFDSVGAPAPDFKLKSYVLVDLRAGFAATDDRYRVSLFVRNVGNEYYWTTVNQTTDTRYRTAGMPRIIGATLSLRTR